MKKINFYDRNLFLLSVVVLLLSLFLTGCSKDDDMETETVIVENETVNETAPFVKTASLAIPGNFTADVWGFNQGAKEYAVVGDMSTSNFNFSIVDVTDPVSPVIVSTTPYPAFDLKVWQNYLYVVNGGHNENEENLGRIYNIQNPAVPVVVGNFPSSHNIFIDSRGYLYLSGRHEMVNNEEKEFGITIFELNSNPTQPQLIWKSDSSPSHDMTVIGNRMYDFQREMGTFIYDVSNPSTPVLLSSLETGMGYDHSGWPTEDGNYLIVTNEFASSSQFNFTTRGGPDVTIWDISSVFNPVKVGELHDNDSRVHNLYIIDDLAYISYYSAGLKIFNVADPKNPVLLYNFDTNGAIGAEAEDGFNGAFGVYPFSNSGNVFVSDINEDLFIFKPNG